MPTPPGRVPEGRGCARGIDAPLPKVMLVMAHGEIAGAERVLLELLAEVAPGPVSVAVPARSELASEIRDLGHRVVDFSLPKLRQVPSTLVYAGAYCRAVAALWRTVGAEEVDVLHGFVATTAKVVSPVALARQVPAMLSVHEMTTPADIGWVRSLAQRSAARVGISQVLAVSQWVADALVRSGYRAEQVAVVHNGISRPGAPMAATDARQLLGIPPHAMVFAVVGRLTRWKGHLVAIEALARLRASALQPAVLVLAGGPFEPADRAYVEELRRRAEAVDVAGAVIFLGHRRDVWPVYDAADVILVPSTEPDPFPTVVLEAQVARRPVVVTSLGGAKEAVDDGESGLVCAPSPDAFADAMARTLDASWRERAGAHGAQKMARELSRSAFASQIVGYWRSTARRWGEARDRGRIRLR